MLNFLKSVEIVALFAFFFHKCLNICRADAQSIRLSCGVNIGEDHLVGEGERMAELLKERLGAGVGVGLEHAPERFVGIIARGGQGGGNLRGMVGIIVDNCNAVDRSLIFKAAVCPVEIMERPSGVVKADVEQIGEGNSGKGV